jgi:hypothetical protein
MKRNTLFALFFIVTFLFVAETASAKGVIIYGTGPHFETKVKLPDEVILEGKHVNFGVAYEQFSIFWVPIWNYGDLEYALIEDSGDVAYSIDDETMEILQEDYGIEISGDPSISFWNKIGGKLIWGAVLLFILWGYIGKKKKGEETEEEVAPD